MRRLVTALWRAEFIWRLSKAAGQRIKRNNLDQALARYPDAQMPGTDAPAIFNKTLAKNLHAAAVFLEQNLGLPRDDARAVARQAFVATGGWVSRLGIKLWLWTERDPFAGVAKRGATPLAEKMWGDGMQLTEQRKDNKISLCVLSCPFCAYFQNADRPDLTPILCEWDASWIAEVETSKRSLRVVLESTLARGDAMCEFAFYDEVKERTVEKVA